MPRRGNEMKITAKDRDDAIKTLRETLRDGDELLISTDWNAGGTVRYCRVILATGRNECAFLTYIIGDATGRATKDRQGRGYLVAKGYGYSASDEIRGDVQRVTGIRVTCRDI